MKGILLIISAAILFLIILYFLIRYILIKLVDKRIANYQNTLISKQYKEVENIYNQMRGWKHDYHNHIQVMKAYLALEKYSEMDIYLDDFAKDLTSIDTIIKTGNIMIDSILNSKLSMAISQDISINAKGSVPRSINIAEIDLCVIIGNLMDNAIEATIKLEKSEDRFIRVYLREMKDQLYISVTNSVRGEVKKVNLEYISSKLGMNHGFGLKRVDSIVNKYGGFINRQNEKGVFATEVILPL